MCFLQTVRFMFYCFSAKFNTCKNLILKENERINLIQFSTSQPSMIILYFSFAFIYNHCIFCFQGSPQNIYKYMLVHILRYVSREWYVSVACSSMFCLQVDAINYYEERENRYREACVLEKQTVVTACLGIMFITFENSLMASRWRHRFSLCRPRPAVIFAAMSWDDGYVLCPHLISKTAIIDLSNYFNKLNVYKYGVAIIQDVYGFMLSTCRQCL